MTPPQQVAEPADEPRAALIATCTCGRRIVAPRHRLRPVAPRQLGDHLPATRPRIRPPRERRQSVSGSVTKVVIVGRAPECDVVIADEYANQRHLRMVQYDDGTVTAEDLASTNGTFLNGQRIPTGQPISVGPGDVIRIGRTALPWKAGTVTGQRHPYAGHPAAPVLEAHELSYWSRHGTLAHCACGATGTSHAAHLAEVLHRAGLLKEHE